jgi:hypothetical protein
MNQPEQPGKRQRQEKSWRPRGCSLRIEWCCGRFSGPTGGNPGRAGVRRAVVNRRAVPREKRLETPLPPARMPASRVPGRSVSDRQRLGSSSETFNSTSSLRFPQSGATRFIRSYPLPPIVGIAGCHIHARGQCVLKPGTCHPSAYRGSCARRATRYCAGCHGQLAALAKFLPAARCIVQPQLPKGGQAAHDTTRYAGKPDLRKRKSPNAASAPASMASAPGSGTIWTW